VILKSWGLCHLKANDISYSRKFESLHFHAQIKFYGISKFTDQAKSSEHFLKKIARARSARNGPKQRGFGPDLPATRRRAISNGWQVGPGCQRLWEAESERTDLGRPIK
jgi:hypothetical protein